MNNVLQELHLDKYIRAADARLQAMQFTEHNWAHVSRVSKMACKILLTLGYDKHTIELAEVASYMHDIGNVINRHDHAHSGALLAYDILMKAGYDLDDVLQIIAAIGNHDEKTGSPVSPIAAALIIADKSDVRRSRVRKTDISTFGIHDRVNYAVSSSTLDIDVENRVITLNLELDTNYSSVVEYFTIFSSRMMLCKKAADYFEMNFCLQINDTVLMN